MGSDQARLRAAFFRSISAYGFRIVEPAILQPAEPFLKLSGEGLKKRLFVTSDGLGRELCLRPDYTLPIAIMHMDERLSQTAQYAYCGTLFRQRDTAEPDEFTQAGVESYGDEDRIIAETAMIQLVIRFLVSEGITGFTLRLTDVALSDRVFDHFNIPLSAQRRLIEACRKDMSVNIDFNELFGFDDTKGQASEMIEAMDSPFDDLLPLLKDSSREGIRVALKAVLSAAGDSHVLGRSMDDLVEHLADRAQQKKRGPLEPEAKAFLSAFFTPERPAERALSEIKSLGERYQLDFGPALSEFEQRLDLLKANGVNMSDVLYSPLFVNRFSYYSGLVFTVDRYNGSGLQPLAAGGRYDDLFRSLNAGVEVPAVGCSMWLDRIAAEVGS